MAVPFSNTKLRAPRGFRNILEGLSREILRSQPSDIYAFGSLYFEKLLQIRAESGVDPVESGAQEEDRFYNNKAYVKDAAAHESHIDRETAAIKIQTKYRQFTAKKVVQGMREEKAARKIQAVYRGHLDRVYVRNVKRASLTADTQAKDAARMEDEEEEEREGDSPSKVMIADIPEKKGVVIVEDTTIEQASVQQQKEMEEGEEEEEEEEEEMSEEMSAMEDAAARIQGGMRGMLVRLSLKGQQKGKEPASAQDEEKVEDQVQQQKKKEDEDEALDEEKQDGDNASEKEDAATRIQEGEDEKGGLKDDGDKPESGKKDAEEEKDTEETE